MIDLDLQLPPNLDELDEMGLSLYAIYFEKPYDPEKAHTFMKIHLFSRAYMMESESVLIFYQSAEFVPANIGYGFDFRLNNEVIYEDLKLKRTSLGLRFKAYFTGNVVYILIPS